MKRRQALKLTTLAFGGSVVGAEFFLAGCKNEKAGVVQFTENTIILLDEIGETILPETERSPGAKAARIGLFMKDMVSDCYSEKEQRTLMEGIDTLNQTSESTYSRAYLELNSDEKLSFLLQLDKEAKEYVNDEIPHYFTMMKQLTLLGYFTSEPGATQALRYNPVPGEFIGCIPYKEGDKAWA